MYSEVPVPKGLDGGRSFDFLKRDLRRTGLPGSQPGTPGGFDSSLHGGYAGAGGSPYGAGMQGSLHGGGGLR